TQNDKNFEKVQSEWVERLTKFVQTYPKADDTAEALSQLGMINEMLGKEVQAKNWYQQMVKDFADSRAGVRAAGAIKRLELEGKAIELAGPQLNNGTPFDISRLRGKIVVVYYWASWNKDCLGDLARLKMLLDEYGSKGLELVCVNLDNSAEEA